MALEVRHHISPTLYVKIKGTWLDFHVFLSYFISKTLIMHETGFLQRLLLPIAFLPVQNWTSQSNIKWWLHHQLHCKMSVFENCVLICLITVRCLTLVNQLMGMTRTSQDLAKMMFSLPEMIFKVWSQQQLLWVFPGPAQPASSSTNSPSFFQY